MKILVLAALALLTACAPTASDPSRTIAQELVSQKGSVSRQEYLDYAGAQFDRLDFNQDGKIDASDLAHR